MSYMNPFYKQKLIALVAMQVNNDTFKNQQVLTKTLQRHRNQK